MQLIIKKDQRGFNKIIIYGAFFYNYCIFSPFNSKCTSFKEFYSEKSKIEFISFIQLNPLKRKLISIFYGSAHFKLVTFILHSIKWNDFIKWIRKISCENILARYQKHLREIKFSDLIISLI